MSHPVYGTFATAAQIDWASKQKSGCDQIAVKYLKEELSRPRKQKVQKLLFGKLQVQKYSI